MMALGAVLTALGAGGTALGQKAAAGGAAAQTEGRRALGDARARSSTARRRARWPRSRWPTARRRRWRSPSRRARGCRRDGQGVPEPARDAPRRQRQPVDVHARPRGRAAGQRDAELGARRRVPVRRAGGRRRADGRRHAQGRRARLPADRRGADPAHGAEVRPDRAATSKAAKGTAVIPVKNTGNTLDPVSGIGQVKGAARDEEPRRSPPCKILPGKTVNLPAGTKLAKGSYTAKVTLTQRGKRALDGDEEVQGQMRSSSRVRFRVRAATLDAVRLEP